MMMLTRCRLTRAISMQTIDAWRRGLTIVSSQLQLVCTHTLHTLYMHTSHIDLYCQRQRCSPMTLVSANIRFVPIFEGVHWTENVKRQWGNRKHGFSRLSTLHLRQLWKSGQSYYTVIFSLLSPVH